jgi:WD40 repeat protein/predicted ATPase/transcriptional regulator with XRE-family HTH domain
VHAFQLRTTRDEVGTARHHYQPRTHAIGQRLVAFRNKTGLTQTELGQLIGVSRRSILKWEGGEGVPNGTHLHHLLEVFADRNAFTAGQELAEAEALWEAVSQAASKRLGQFNTPWFAELLARQAPRDAGPRPSPTLASPALHHPSAIIDWGEAIDVPTLQGRAAELAQLKQWVLTDRSRVVALLGLGGIGKTSLALTFAQEALPHFEFVLFRSLQNGPALAELLDQAIHVVSGQQATPPEKLSDKIAQLTQLFRERRCLLILDNFETIMQPGTITGTYRAGYAEYGILLRALSERKHQSCVIVTSREKPAELGSLEGRAGPVRTLSLPGLDDGACQSILEAQDIVGTASDLLALARLYSGNPLALALVTEPIRELFGGDVGAFLAAGNAFFNGVGVLLYTQLARSTPLEQAILYWLAVEREHVPLSALLLDLGDDVPQREVLAALESLRHRMLIERGLSNATFTLQPVILEYLTDSLIEAIAKEVADGRPRLLSSHAIVLATAKEYLRHSQEQLIATPLLVRMGNSSVAERQILSLLASWRNQPQLAQGYGPGNAINLLRLLRGHLRNLDLARLAIRQAVLQGVDVQDTSLAGASLKDTFFTEPFDAITAVAISSTGEYWAAATTRGEVLVWAAAGPTLHRSWRAHTDMVWALAFSPDGRTLASGGWDGAVKLWDVDDGALLWWGRHTGHVNRVAFSPDGGILAGSMNDATVRLWDLRTGAQLDTLAHPAPVPAIAWSSDGQLLASGDAHGDIRLWKVQKPGPAACEHLLTGHSNWIDGLAFAPDSGTLASASWDGTIKFWDTSAALSADAASSHLLQTLAGHTDQVSRVVWSPDGRTLASSSRDQSIRLWDVDSRSVRAVLRGHTAGAKGLAFTPDNRSLLSGGGDGVLRVWNTASGECTRVLQGYAASLDDVDWSADGAQLVSGGTDTLVTVFTLTGSTTPRTMRGHGGLVIGVGWSPDGQWLASSEWDNAIRLWDPASGASLAVVQHPDDPGNYFYGLAWSPDGQRLAAGTNRHGVFVWDVRAHAQPWSTREFSTWIRHVAWSPDGAQVAGGGDDGTVYVWDAINGALLQQLSGHHSMVTRLAWSADGTRLASGGGGSERGELFVWDTQRGECVHAITEHPGIVYAVAWGASAQVLSSGGADGVLRWWDVDTGECIRVREAHQGRVQSLRRSPDGRKLASCGDGGAIRIWDLHSGELLQTIRRDRPYERMDITGTTGISDAQRASLIALGAHEELAVQELATTNSAPSITIASDAADEQQTGDNRKHGINLPFQPTSFVGRSDELDAIDRLLADPACRLLTLIGPGGIGKTRLALATAARQSGAFADGIAFVPLASINSPDQIVFAIGDAVALSFAGQPDPATHLLSHLRARHMLLVLDNFEHLLHGTDLVSDMLAHAPQASLLITSRERLNLQAEWLVDVKGLAYPPADPHWSAMPERMAPPIDYSAVQLFVQRAAQSQPDLSLSEATLTTIGRICQHIAGMPLAIELAAASLRTLSLAEIEGQIRENLDVLATTLRDVPARHRSLRAVFDHSWQLLSEGERALVSGLAVFCGGWTAEAAKQVVRATRAALTALIDKSLVYQANAEASTLAAGSEPNFQEAPRYLMLEPIREYALERLASHTDAETIRQRHASYFSTLAEAAAAEWNTPRIEAAIANLRREYDNMRAALQWASDTNNSAVGLRLAQALWKFWRSRSYTSEGRAWLEQLLALDEHPGDASAIVARHRGIQAAAWLASDQHDFETATWLFEQSRALRSALGEAAGETELLINAARKARVAGHYQQATALLEDVLARHRALTSHTAIGSAKPELSLDEFGLVLRELGLVLREQGDFSRATALFAEGLTLHRMVGDRESEALALLGLADVARDGGEAAGVRMYSEPSLAILRELGIEWAIGFALHTLALGTYYEGDLTRAYALIHESIALFRSLRAEGSLAEVLITFGKIALARGEEAAAYTALIEALQYAWAVGPRLMVAPALEGLASVLVAQGHVELAARLMAAAAAVRAQMGTPVWPADRAAVEQTLASAHSTLNDTTFTHIWAEAQSVPLEQILYRIPSATAFAGLDN